MENRLEIRHPLAITVSMIITCLLITLSFHVNAFAEPMITTSLYEVNADGKGKKRVGKPDSSNGAWSPDGSMIAYSYSKKNGVKGSIYTANADGSNKKKLTKGKKTVITEVSWVSADQISYARFARDFSHGLYVMNKDGSGLKRIMKTKSLIDSFDWSPDGSQVAYTICEDTSCDVYVANSDGTGKKRIVKKAFNPVWSTDGSQVGYVGYKKPHVTKYKTLKVYVVNKDGSGKSLLTTLKKRAKPSTLMAIDITADFKKIAYAASKMSKESVVYGYDIYTINSDGTGFKRVVKNRKGEHLFGVRWSPDASSILFDSVIGLDA